MTDRRPLLRAIFDAAVAAAHPDVVLSAHLPPAPKGRVICLAAGKGAAAMAAAAERHYLDRLFLPPSRPSGGAPPRPAPPPPPSGTISTGLASSHRGSRGSRPPGTATACRRDGSGSSKPAIPFRTKRA